MDYGIGASATMIDQLNDLPSNVLAVVIEPDRTDLPHVKIELSRMIQRFKILLPLRGALSLLYPFFAFFYGLNIASNLKPDIVFSMHHPFHTLSLTGHFISRILHVPHVVDLHDVLRPMGQKLTTSYFLKDVLERKVAKIIKNDTLIFVCNENKQILESRANINFNNVLVLPNCVSRSLVNNVDMKKHSEKKTIQFIFVGRISHEYGLNKIQALLDALPTFGYTPHLLVVGHDQTGVPDCATYLGTLSRRETIQLVAESDVGIGPLNPTIAVPRKVVEYLTLGKIVIVGKNAVSKDFLKEYEEYIIEISETEDVNKIISKLLTMLKTVNYDHKKMEKLYCINRMKKILEKVFQSY